MEIKRFMTEQLQKGFAGERGTSSRIENGFEIKYASSRQDDGPEEGSVYLDQWTKGRLGVGMELGSHSGQSMPTETLGRVYGGGTLPEEELRKMGITRDAVLDKITKIITKHGSETRLMDEFHPEPDGAWQYSYDVIARYPAFELCLAEETLRYGGKLVFIHPFILSPLKK